MIFMACSRSSLAASKNSLAKPGLFIVSLEKWAPWNKNQTVPCFNESLQADIYNVCSAQCTSPIYVHTHTYTHKRHITWHLTMVTSIFSNMHCPFHQVTCATSCHLQRTSKHKAQKLKRLRWSRGSVLPLSTRVRGFKPGRSREDFSGRKKSSARLPSEGKYSHRSHVVNLRHVKDP
jgi:hypothetical protein